MSNSAGDTPQEIHVGSDEGAAELVMGVRHSAEPELTEWESRVLGAVEDYLVEDAEDE